VGGEVAVGIRPEHLNGANGAAGDLPRLRGRATFVELLGAERSVQVELPAEPVAVDGARPATEGRALATARFDAYAPVDAGDLVELAVTVERLHFFDLGTGLAIRGDEDGRAGMRGGPPASL
jgi:multiple sugar transport system ATP-binding protein